MKNLARHIEWLLHDNDCVILPGFGGFIAHIVPAYYVSNENLYYPPSRSISFNTAITMNDGLLAQSYMRSYNIDYAQATYLVDIAIEKLRDALDEEGSVTLPHIGTIKQDIHQTIQFIAEPAGIPSPLHFGLGAFTINTLAWLQSQSDKAVQQPKSIFTQTERTIDVHIPKKTLRQFFSTAAVFLLLLMVALPAGDLRPTDIASLHLTGIICEPKNEHPEPLYSQPVDTVAESGEKSITVTAIESTAMTEGAENVENIESEDTLETQEAEMTQEAEKSYNASEVTASVASPVSVEVTEITQPKTSNKVYHIIVASLPSHRGADEIIESYITKGYPQATLVERDNRVRISLVNFTDKDEANNYLNTLRKNESFANAWLLPVNK